MPVFFPESETFELSNSNSMLVEEFDASDFVWLTSGELLIINSSSSPSFFNKNGSSP